jgi:hypothetical protein
MDLASSLVTAGGSLLGGLIGKSGQSSANKTNYKIAQEQMKFQERMSNTAYQRAADDMEKAGLNRILALGNPASSPVGATATMQNENTQLAQNLSTVVPQALTAMQQIANVEKTRAETQNLKQTGTIKTPLEDVAQLFGKQTSWIEDALKDIGVMNKSGNLRLLDEIKQVRKWVDGVKSKASKIDEIDFNDQFKNLMDYIDDQIKWNAVPKEERIHPERPISIRWERNPKDSKDD